MQTQFLLFTVNIYFFSIKNIPLHILYHSIRVRTAPPVSVRVRVRVSLSVSIYGGCICISYSACVPVLVHPHYSKLMAGKL